MRAYFVLFCPPVTCVITGTRSIDFAEAVQKTLEEYVEFRDRYQGKLSGDLRRCNEDREKLKKKMEATPAHKNYAKWMKTRSSLKSTKQDLQKKLKLGVVLPPTVIKNNCESIFTDNPCTPERRHQQPVSGLASGTTFVSRHATAQPLSAW